MTMFEQYEHHGRMVWVNRALKGLHTDSCLCYSCAKFKPGTPENCPQAQLLYNYCVMLGMTTPVWECPIFEEKP